MGFIYSYVAVDFLGYCLSQHPALQSRSEVGYFAVPVVTQVQLAWMMAFRSGFEMSVGYYLVAGMTVCFGIFDPRCWPPMFGSFSKGYTREIFGANAGTKTSWKYEQVQCNSIQNTSQIG